MRRKEMMKMNMEKMNRNMLITLTRKEMVMKMEKMNMPPKPYRWSVRLPLLQIWGYNVTSPGADSSLSATCP